MLPDSPGGFAGTTKVFQMGVLEVILSFLALWSDFREVICGVANCGGNKLNLVLQLMD